MPFLRRRHQGCSRRGVGSPSRSYGPACWEGSRRSLRRGASSRRAARCQQGAVLGTVIFLAMTGVFVGQGRRVVAHHDTPAWMSGLSTVLLRHGGVSLVLAGWSCVRLWRLRGLRPTERWGRRLLSWSLVLAKERAMQAQICPPCAGEGLEHHLARSRAQTFRESPRFYSVYCPVCGHIDGIFAQAVFPSPPSAPSGVRIAIAHR